jgi:hypothetical protein
MTFIVIKTTASCFLKKYMFACTFIHGLAPIYTPAHVQLLIFDKLAGIHDG